MAVLAAPGQRLRRLLGHHLALAVIVVAAVEPVGDAGDPAVRHGFAQAVHRVVGVDIVQMGGEAVERGGVRL